MTVVTVGDLKARFSEILKSVQAGEEFAIAFGRKKEVLAYLVPRPTTKKAGGRPLGLLEGKATLKISEDFKMTEEEFLGL